jgi:lactoylglutathione lyase
MINLNNITGIQHIGIPTKDMQKTLDFYNGLGFETVFETLNPASNEKVAFLRLKNLVIETYESAASGKPGAIDHVCLDVLNIENVFSELRSGEYNLLDDEIQFLPFWENGVRFVTIDGPNTEKIEFCQKL